MFLGKVESIGRFVGVAMIVDGVVALKLASGLMLCSRRPAR